MFTFVDLAGAVQFLADALEANDDDALANASREALPVSWILEQLREQNATTPFVELYAGRVFPPSATVYKLGGHSKELGHIHIDFVGSEIGWEIERIWMCR